MKIEEMRVGGRYICEGCEVECVALSVVPPGQALPIAGEAIGTKGPQAAYRDGNIWRWRSCDEYQPCTPESKHTKVRLAVAVADDGAYAVAGWTSSYQGSAPQAVSDDSMRATAIDSLDRSESVVHFVEVEVPLPLSLELKGTVV